MGVEVSHCVMLEQLVSTLEFCGPCQPVLWLTMSCYHYNCMYHSSDYGTEDQLCQEIT